MLNIVLVNPEIPQNTGNIARTCSCTNTNLHIVLPIPFDISLKAAKRAGMDYWEDAKLIFHNDYKSFLSFVGKRPIYATSPRGEHKYTDISFEKDCFILFGKESVGLDNTILQNNTCIYIPMMQQKRALNLSNCVAIVTYEYIRQTNCL